MNGSEAVLIGATPATGWFDPAEHRLYFDPGAPIARGAMVTIRGALRLVTEVEVWQDGGVVAHLLPGPVHLPDQIQIFDMVEADFIDPETGQIPTVELIIWPTAPDPGMALIEAEEDASASDLDVMGRRNELVRYKIRTELELTGVQQGMRIRVLSSLDPRLEGRILHVDRVLAGSYAQERLILAVERQT